MPRSLYGWAGLRKISLAPSNPSTSIQVFQYPFVDRLWTDLALWLKAAIGGTGNGIYLVGSESFIGIDPVLTNTKQLGIRSGRALEFIAGYRRLFLYVFDTTNSRVCLATSHRDFQLRGR